MRQRPVVSTRRPHGNNAWERAKAERGRSEGIRDQGRHLGLEGPSKASVLIEGVCCTASRSFDLRPRFAYAASGHLTSLLPSLFVDMQEEGECDPGSVSMCKHLDDVGLVEAQRGDLQELKARLVCCACIHSCQAAQPASMPVSISCRGQAPRSAGAW